MKTYVLDASALWIFLQRKPAAPKIASLLAEALRDRAQAIMSTVNLGEVYGLVLREQGHDRAQAAVGIIYQLPVQLADATAQRCIHAAELKAKNSLHYADAFAAALAVERKATLVTSDSDFRRLGHGFPILWLKN